MPVLQLRRKACGLKKFYTDEGESAMGELIELKKIKDGKSRKAYYILAVLLLATAALIYVNVAHSAYKKVLKLDNASIMSLENSSYNFGKTSSNIIVCGQEGLSAINKNGEIQWKFSSNAVSPLLSSEGDYCLYSDMGAFKTTLVNGGKEVYTLNSSYEIITASVNKNGYFAVASKERGFKSQVAVFSASGEQIYAWHSVNYYVLAVCVTDDNKGMFVSVLNADNGGDNLCSVLYFNFKDEEPAVIQNTEGNMVSVLKNTENGVLAVGDVAMLGYTRGGKTDFCTDYEGRTLFEYAATNNTVVLGLSASASDGGLGGSVIESYSTGGVKKGAYRLDGEIKFLDTDSGKILVNSDDGAYILTDSCRLSGSLTFENEVREGLVFSGGKKLLLVNGSSVNIYDIK